MIDNTLHLTKKYARIVAVGDGSYTIYTWDPDRKIKTNEKFNNYEDAQEYAKKFMEYEL